MNSARAPHDDHATHDVTETHWYARDEIRSSEAQVRLLPSLRGERSRLRIGWSANWYETSQNSG